MKPTFRVTELIYCPSMSHSFQAIRAMRLGSIAHGVVQAWLESKGMKTEVELRVDRGFYVLIGHADAIDFSTNTVYEIKPDIDAREYVVQLSAYVEMAEIVYGGKWNGAFVLYGGNEIVIQPVTVMRGVLKSLDLMAAALIFAERNGHRLAKKNSFCRFCKRDGCPVKRGKAKMIISRIV